MKCAERGKQKTEDFTALGVDSPLPSSKGNYFEKLFAFGNLFIFIMTLTPFFIRL
jgi:hypothetical protein